MTKDENQIGKIETFYNRLHKSKIVKVTTVVIAVVLATISFSMFVVDSGGIRDLYGYPEEEYQYLSEQIEKVITDNSIDMKQITDNEIASEVTYITDVGQEEWSSAEIKLTKQNKSVSLSITKNDNKTLNLDDVTHMSKFEHYFCATLGLAIFFALYFIASFAISLIANCICVGIIWILMNIEKKNKKREKSI